MIKSLFQRKLNFSWIALLVAIVSCTTQGPETASKTTSPSNKTAALRDPASIDIAQKAAEALEKRGVLFARSPKVNGDSVVAVDCRFCDIKDEDMAQFRSFHNLITLDLTGRAITDVGLKDIGALQGLKHLYLKGSAISDAGLNKLSDLESLETLDLSETSVSDAGMEHLEPLMNLMALYLSNTRVGNQGMENLKTLTKLQRLDVSKQEPPPGTQPVQQTRDATKISAENPVSDAGLKSLKNLRQLSFLKLSGNKLTDEGLTSIKPLAKLQMLLLARTAITDRGLKELESLNQLTLLEASSTGVSAEGASRLKSKLPNVSINLIP